MRVPDRQKQRQEYLKKKIGGFGKGLGAGLASMVMAAVTGLLIAVGLMVIFEAGRADISAKQSVLALFSGIGLIILGCIMGRTALRSGHYARRQVSSAALLPYIPPITSDTLPVDEVLVRGSEEPAEQSCVLLRAAGERADIPAEQLLRASSGKRASE